MADRPEACIGKYCEVKPGFLIDASFGINPKVNIFVCYSIASAINGSRTISLMSLNQQRIHCQPLAFRLAPQFVGILVLSSVNIIVVGGAYANYCGAAVNVQH